MSEAAIDEFQKVASGVYLEGLAIDHERDTVWYSDVIAGGIHGVKSDGTPLASFNPDRMWTGGVLVNADGKVLSSGQGGIMWNDPETGRAGWLVDEIDGKPINGINEMVPDGEGGIFFGTNDIEMVIAAGEPRPTEIYRLTAARELIRLADGIGFSNGIMFDEERRALYCNDTFHCTWAFDVDADFRLANKRCLLEKADVDGMALDANGNVWITGFRSSHITRLAPEGQRLADFATPAGSITQLRFGGADMRDIYFNSVPSDGGDTLKDGGELTARNSFLFKGRSETPGMKLASPRFVLG